MLITPHALVGATIAVSINNPFLALPLAVGSHFVLDKIPHWQEILYPYRVTHKTWIRIPLDLFLSLILVYLITQHHPTKALIIWVTAFLAVFPDLDGIAFSYPHLFKIPVLKRFIDWHIKIQNETSSLWGLVPQIIIISLSLSLSL
ncbi:MAG: hypothetical protein Q7R97_03865 [Candidatus Daviesbacteria bacterium]|nr:hypothetical protein [Candidatus Daviesbacteria bacterium]